MTVPNHEGAQQQPDTLRDALERLRTQVEWERAQFAAQLKYDAANAMAGVLIALDSAQLVGQHGYLFMEYADGKRATLPWQTVVEMLRAAGHNVYAQPGFVGQQQQPSEPCPKCKGRGTYEHPEMGSLICDCADIWTNMGRSLSHLPHAAHQRTQLASEPRRCPSCGSVKWECSDCANPDVNQVSENSSNANIDGSVPK